jgi:hypothetical protein
MDHEIDKQEPSSTEGGQMKAGDKVWVLCEVATVYNYQSLYIDIRHDGAVFEAKRSDCRPVEPSNSPEIPDGSSEPLAVGDAVRFVLPGHDRHGAEGIILSIVRGPNRQYRFDSNCGQFHRYCTASELELITKQYRTPTLADLADGHIFCESRDDKWQEWKTMILTEILDGPGYPFLCLSAGANNALRYAECRIEASE